MFNLQVNIKMSIIVLKFFVISTDENKIDTESSISIQTKPQSNNNKTNRQKQSNPRTKYCPSCQHDFSHRSAYLRHIRQVHQGHIPTMTSNNDNALEVKKKKNKNIKNQFFIIFYLG